MKVINTVIGITAYFIIGIVRFVFNMLHNVFEWIEKFHIRMMRAALELADVPQAKELFNFIMDANAKSMVNMADKYYISQKFEL